MEITTGPAATTDTDTDTGGSAVDAKRRWLRRLVLGASCVPLAVVSVLHTMGRTHEFGVLGEWYVMATLTVAGLLAWALIEKAFSRYDT